MNNKKKMIIVILVLIILIGALLVFKKVFNNNNNPENPGPIVTNPNDRFDYKVIKETNNLIKNQNYLVSPLSMGYALSLLNEGADGNTKTEIENVLNNYAFPSIINVKDRIGIANLLFVRDIYKDDISTDYISTLQNNYSSDLIIDKFITPDKANEWIKEKTFNMIKNPIKNLSSNFVLGLANAIAIDLEWKNKFECTKTSSEDFTKVDGTKIKTAMMHSENDVYYISNDNAKGIIKDYAMYDITTGQRVYEENSNTISLEYIAIMPNKDINKYLKTFDEKELINLLESKKRSALNADIKYSLPKYTYDFSYKDFSKMLTNLGMKDAFNPEKANFKKMVKKESLLELYVSKAIHKTHIELSENGTKAAAVTIFLMDKNADMFEQKEVIKIDFNKPFIYIIKEKASENIWFFGTVYEPMKWEENTNNCNYN